MDPHALTGCTAVDKNLAVVKKVVWEKYELTGSCLLNNFSL